MSKLTVKGKNKSNQSNRNYTKKVWYKKLKKQSSKMYILWRRDIY